MKQIKDDIIKWFSDNMKIMSGTKAIIGISGGKDSTIAAAIAVTALGKENVYGVLMPNYNTGDFNSEVELREDLRDGIAVCDILDIKYIIHPIYNTATDILETVQASLSKLVESKEHSASLSPVTKINTLPRIRMTILYAIAGSISGARVVNTSNMSEQFVGYCTKWGDMCGDIYPLLNLTVRAVLSLGDEFTNIPTEYIHKPPADGLTGRTDEEILGVTYDEIDDYILGGETCLSSTEHILIEKHKLAAHKIKQGPSFQPNIS